jgi:hypothetical protein
MNWLDVLMIVFSATAANHLGLVAAAESVVRHRLPILNCPKCAAFWLVLIYGCSVCCDTIAALPPVIPEILAAAFLSAWSAIWLDLFMGIIDQLYTKLYGTIYPATNTADTDALDTADPVSDMSE